MDDRTAMSFYGLAWNLISAHKPEKIRFQTLKNAIAHRFPCWSPEEITAAAWDFVAAFADEAYEMEAA